MEMLKSTKYIFLLVFSFALLSLQSSFAQDTLDVPQGFATLNDAVSGDTTATGEPQNLNRVWRLERGGWYIVNASLKTNAGSPLRIVAAEGDGHQPIIVSAVMEDIGAANRPFTPTGDAEFVDLYVSGINDLGEAARKNMFRLEGEGSRYVLDKCFFDHDAQAFIRQNAPGQKLFITNCIFRSAATVNDPWDGIMIASRGGYQDTIFVENNTFMVASNRFWQAYSGVMHNVTFNHNTFVQSGGVYDGNFETNRTVNLTVTNNLFMDISLEGDRTIIDGVTDTLVQEIFSVDSLFADSIATDEERSILFSNNVYGWSQEVKDYIAAHSDSLGFFQFHNPSTWAVINNFDGMVSENNLVETVVFTDAPDINKFVEYATDRLEFGGPYGRMDGLIDIRADRNGIDPIATGPETFGLSDNEYDLSYSNTHAAYSYSTGSYPVGDLNWFPEVIVSVEDRGNKSLAPTEFSLGQNYPNPFNPATSIQFVIPESGVVTLSVHNLIGEKVAELINEELPSGSYEYNFDASSLSSGIYFYSIKTNTFSQTKKMLLLK